ncbi:hypothetical protein GCM10009639_66480 [Kitasatospora putterlickiae]|uniref:Uncharacterized protein n=1 Tax=Kitasatospora putterlickiae TaxID=221725 RepID=A0ABN1YH12_9ACTN
MVAPPERVDVGALGAARGAGVGPEHPFVGGADGVDGGERGEQQADPDGRGGGDGEQPGDGLPAAADGEAQGEGYHEATRPAGALPAGWPVESVRARPSRTTASRSA